VILSIFSIEQCTFGLAEATTNSSVHMNAWGIFTTPVYDVNGHIQGCIPHHSSMELEASLKTAQAFGIMLVVFTTTIFLGLTLVQFFLEWGTLPIYYTIRALLPCGFFCQLLTFSSFGSKFCYEIVIEMEEGEGSLPATCTPGSAGVVAIFNGVAIIVMMALMNIVIPPDHPVFQLYGTGNCASLVGNNGKGNNQDRHDLPRRRKHQSNRHCTGISKHGRTSFHPGDSTRSRQVEQYTIREPQRPGREKIRTTVVNGPDVRKTIKEITHTDGSQTITTTIETLMSYVSDADIIDGDSEATTIGELLSKSSEPGFADHHSSADSITTHEDEDSISLDEVL
jgi:hypothetical protein